MSSGSEKNRVLEERENGSDANLIKSKSETMFRFAKVKNRLRRRKTRDNNSNCNSLGCFGKRVSGGGGGGSGDGGGGCCFLCFKKRPSLGSRAESRTSDPNSAEFTHELLRSLIETNDFYSKECNCHGIDDK